MTPETVTGYWYRGYKDDHFIEMMPNELPTELFIDKWDRTTDAQEIVERDYPRMLSYDVLSAAEGEHYVESYFGGGAVLLAKNPVGI